LNDLLDVPAALRWISGRPKIRFRALSALSPFAAAWIEPGQSDALQYEAPELALKRLHARLVSEAACSGR
jgi:hypothetical protein